VVALAACGADAPRARTSASHPVDAGPSRRDAALDTQNELATLDEIAAAATSAAPGMREAARFEGSAPMEREIARAAERDACARAAFVATGPIDVALVDGKGAVIAEHSNVSRGVIGTACVARGGAIGLRVSAGDAGTARYFVRAVAWIAP
jgi:hypothetical protein